MVCVPKWVYYTPCGGRNNSIEKSSFCHYFLWPSLLSCNVRSYGVSRKSTAGKVPTARRLLLIWIFTFTCTPLSTFPCDSIIYNDHFIAINNNGYPGNCYRSLRCHYSTLSLFHLRLVGVPPQPISRFYIFIKLPSLLCCCLSAALFIFSRRIFLTITSVAAKLHYLLYIFIITPIISGALSALMLPVTMLSLRDAFSFSYWWGTDHFLCVRKIVGEKEKMHSQRENKNKE